MRRVRRIISLIVFLLAPSLALAHGSMIPIFGQLFFPLLVSILGSILVLKQPGNRILSMFFGVLSVACSILIWGVAAGYSMGLFDFVMPIIGPILVIAFIKFVFERQLNGSD